MLACLGLEKIPKAQDISLVRPLSLVLLYWLFEKVMFLIHLKVNFISCFINRV